MCARPAEPGCSPADRRLQILDAAMACFARKGLHPTTMQDISEQAGISVGLIYRYFESKEQVIATMASEHLAELRRKLEEARSQPDLLEALGHVLWCDHDADVGAAFVVDLFAEAARNPQVRVLVRDVHDAVVRGCSELIAASPEAARLAPGFTAGDAAEMVFHAIHGRLFDEIVTQGRRTASEIKADRIATLRRLLALLLPASGPRPGATGSLDAP